MGLSALLYYWDLVWKSERLERTETMGRGQICKILMCFSDENVPPVLFLGELESA